MFGIGIGELILVILIIFLISPKELPKVMRKIGQFFNEMNRLKKEVMQLKKDVEDIVEEGKVDLNFIDEEIKDVNMSVQNSGKKKIIHTGLKKNRKPHIIKKKED